MDFHSHLIQNKKNQNQINTKIEALRLNMFLKTLQDFVSFNQTDCDLDLQTC